MRRRIGLMAAGLVGLLAATAATQTGPSRKYINLPGRPIEAPFSDAVLAGETLYLAGRIGLDPATGKPPQEIEREARLLLDGIKTTLAAAGMTMDDLVFVQIFCPDLALYDQFNAIYKTYFGKDYPARAFIGSGPLIRGGRFEMQGIAVRR